MTNAILMEKLNKEVRTLRRDVRRMEAALSKVIAIPAESVNEYRNTNHIRQAYRKALKTRAAR